jgi:hypothetical protein
MLIDSVLPPSSIYIAMHVRNNSGFIVFGAVVMEENGLCCGARRMMK